MNTDMFFLHITCNRNHWLKFHRGVNMSLCWLNLKVRAVTPMFRIIHWNLRDSIWYLSHRIAIPLNNISSQVNHVLEVAWQDLNRVTNRRDTKQLFNMLTQLCRNPNRMQRGCHLPKSSKSQPKWPRRNDIRRRTPIQQANLPRVWVPKRGIGFSINHNNTRSDHEYPKNTLPPKRLIRKRKTTTTGTLKHLRSTRMNNGRAHIVKRQEHLSGLSILEELAILVRLQQQFIQILVRQIQRLRNQVSDRSGMRQTGIIYQQHSTKFPRSQNYPPPFATTGPNAFHLQLQLTDMEMALLGKGQQNISNPCIGRGFSNTLKHKHRFPQKKSSTENIKETLASRVQGNPHQTTCRKRLTTKPCWEHPGFSSSSMQFNKGLVRCNGTM